MTINQILSGDKLIGASGIPIGDMYTDTGKEKRLRKAPKLKKSVYGTDKASNGDGGNSSGANGSGE